MSFNETKHHGTADFPVELYHLDNNHPKYEMAFHWHSAIEIISVNKGRLDVSLNSKSIKASAEDIIISNSETIHGALPYDCEYDCIVFHPEEFITGENNCRAFIDNLLDGSVLLTDHLNKQEHPEIAQTISELTEHMSNQEDGYNFAVIGLLYKFFSQMINGGHYVRNTGKAPERDVARLKIALRYIRENYENDLKLADIAEKVSMSPKYFCRFFKDMTDKTPIEYLITYRIERAAKKLVSDKETITEISLACGFSDLSYFTKLFKRYKGVTPRQFRKNNIKS